MNVYAPWNPGKGADDLHYDDYVLEIQADGDWSVRLLNPAPTPPPRQEGIPLTRVLGTHTGVGNGDVLQGLADANVPNSPILFDIDFRGGSAIDVMIQDVLAQYDAALTPRSTTGPYRGVRALPYRDGVLDGRVISAFHIHVAALGPWEVKVGLPDFEAAPITEAEGSGDLVVGPFVLTSEDLSQADFNFEVTHDGGKFEARLIASDGTDVLLIPPQQASFEDKRAPVTVYAPAVGEAGDLPYGKYVLAVQADGEWSVSLLGAASEEDDPAES